MASKQKNDFTISARVIWVGMPVEIPKTNIMKRVLVIEVWVETKYRKEVPIDFVNDNMKMLNNIRADDWVVLDFFLRGNKQIQGDGKARWFTNLEGTSCTVER